MMLYEEPKYKVIKTDFDHLEGFLNSLDDEYPLYGVYQILHEHRYDGTLAVVILERCY